MKNFCITLLILIFLFSCSTKNNLVYIKNSEKENITKIDYSKIKNLIEIGDILNIVVQTINPEASIPYNKTNLIQTSVNNIDLVKLEGYLVDKNMMINFPVLGKISIYDFDTEDLENKITKLLIDGGHLTNPTVKVRRVNSKFTIIGEVSLAGTFSYYDKNLNIFQALGYAGDLTIEGKRKNVTLIREENGLRKIYKIDLTNSNIFKKPFYYIKNNDVLIVEPNFSKVKSAGFIGSPSSIASFASLILSLTLLIINR